MKRFDLERSPTDLLPRGLPVHTLHRLLLVCTTQLSSRLFDELQSHGIIRAHTRDRVSRGLSTAEGLAPGVRERRLYTPPQALVVYPRSQLSPLASLDRPRLLAPVAPLGKLATALDAFLTKAAQAGTLLEASLEELREATEKAFLGLLVPLVRRGLIEGVYGSDVSGVSPSEALCKVTCIQIRNLPQI